MSSEYSIHKILEFRIRSSSISAKMHAKSFDRLSQKPVQIKQELGFSARVLSKETSIANSSFRVYYGGSSGAVPFRWESQPGTPKHPSFDISVPPLTPPPSYYLSSFSNFGPNSINKSCSKTNILKTLIRKLSHKRAQNPDSSSVSSFSLSSSRSFSSPSPAAGSLSLNETERRRFSSPNINYFVDQDEDEPQKFIASTHGSSESGVSWTGFRGCNFRFGKAKNAFSSILGHGSAKTASAF